MGIELEGMDKAITMIADQEILWGEKRRAVIAAAEHAQEDAYQASLALQDKGYLKKSWKVSFYNDQDNATARVYSKTYHDIYNELGSPTNMKNVGFFSRAIEHNRGKYYDIMIREIFDDK